MVDRSTLTLLYDYHYWANRRLMAACEALTAEQWGRPLGHSWGSVHGLLVHLLAAEQIWFARWQGESPTSISAPDSYPTLAAIRLAWTPLEGALRAFVAGCDADRLAADLAYRNTRGEAYTLPLGELMLHLANHGTHHRGELAAMLAVLNVPHPEDDLLGYLIERRLAG